MENKFVFNYTFACYQEVKVSDPYESAIVALPAVVTERLLRIMRLGIATRYDVSVMLWNLFQ